MRIYTHIPGFQPIEKIICQICAKQQIEKGLSYICFTDHIDLNPADAGYNYLSYEEYSEAIARARDEFGGKIQILKGIEFAEPHLYPREFEKITKKDFDVIMAGVHYLGQYYVGDGILSRKYSNPERFNEYYRELLKQLNSGGLMCWPVFYPPRGHQKPTENLMFLVWVNIMFYKKTCFRS